MGSKNYSGRGPQTARTKPDPQTPFLGLPTPLALEACFSRHCSAIHWLRCRRGDLGFISLS